MPKRKTIEYQILEWAEQAPVVEVKVLWNIIAPRVKARIAALEPPKKRRGRKPNGTDKPDAQPAMQYAGPEAEARAAERKAKASEQRG